MRSLGDAVWTVETPPPAYCRWAREPVGRSVLEGLAKWVNRVWRFRTTTYVIVHIMITHLAGAHTAYLHRVTAALVVGFLYFARAPSPPPFNNTHAHAHILCVQGAFPSTPVPFSRWNCAFYRILICRK